MPCPIGHTPPVYAAVGLSPRLHFQPTSHASSSVVSHTTVVVACPLHIVASTVVISWLLLGTVYYLNVFSSPFSSPFAYPKKSISDEPPSVTGCLGSYRRHSPVLSKIVGPDRLFKIDLQ